MVTDKSFNYLLNSLMFIIFIIFDFVEPFGVRTSGAEKKAAEQQNIYSHLITK